MAPPQAIPILGQIEDTPVQVSYLWIPGGCHICPRAAGLTSIIESLRNENVNLNGNVMTSSSWGRRCREYFNYE